MKLQVNKVLLPLVFLLGGCSIPLDKQMHIAAGVGISGGTLAIGGSPSQACALAAASGLAKEAYDSTGRGTVDTKDFIATALSGCLVALVINEILE